MARSLNHCCGIKATMHYVCAVELHITINYIKIMSDAQQCFYGNLMSSATIKRT